MRLRRHLVPWLTLAVVLTSGACSQELFDLECDLVVVNESTCALSVVVDGREALVVRPGTDRSVAGIGPGRHVLEALDARGNLVQRRTIELATGEDFYWTLGHC